MSNGQPGQRAESVVPPWWSRGWSRRGGRLRAGPADGRGARPRQLAERVAQGPQKIPGECQGTGIPL